MPDDPAAAVAAPAPLRTSDTCTEQPFERWLAGIDQLTRRMIGLSVHDLPDMAFRDAYDAGSSIRAFCNEELRRCLADEGFEALLGGGE